MDHDKLPRTVPLELPDIQTVFLPSPHHQNPRFRPLPWQPAPRPPSTPLNTFLLTVFAKAHRSLYLQTPNLTAPPVLSALLSALARGLDVHIVTSRRLMILEQLVTAGMTTERCVWRLVRRYLRMWKERMGLVSADERSVEEGQAITMSVGRLRIEYYQPKARSGGHDQEDAYKTAEPVQSHLKLTVADNELVILGSGNLDRASWYTSQELGVAFFSTEFASRLTRTLDAVLKERKILVFDSDGT